MGLKLRDAAVRLKHRRAIYVKNIRSTDQLIPIPSVVQLASLDTSLSGHMGALILSQQTTSHPWTICSRKRLWIKATPANPSEPLLHTRVIAGRIFSLLSDSRSRSCDFTENSAFIEFQGKRKIRRVTRTRVAITTMRRRHRPRLPR